MGTTIAFKVVFEPRLFPDLCITFSRQDQSKQREERKRKREEGEEKREQTLGLFDGETFVTDDVAAIEEKRRFGGEGEELVAEEAGANRVDGAKGSGVINDGEMRDVFHGEDCLLDDGSRTL